MKRYIFILLLSFLTLWLMAVPAMRIRRSVTLDDGRTVMVTAYGDEYLDYLLSDEGEVIIEQDGTFHSKECPRATYDWYFKGTCMDGDETEMKGSVTLIR